MAALTNSKDPVRGSCWLVAAAVLLLACGSSQDRIATHIERGEQYLEDGQAQAAILEFRSALKLSPENAALYERIGEVLYSHSRFDSSLEYFQHAYRLDESRIRAAMREARLVASSDPERSNFLVTRALSEAPELPIVQRTHAHVALLSGDPELAGVAALRAVELDPGDAESWAELATVHRGRIAAQQMRHEQPDPRVFEDAIAALVRVDELRGGLPRARLQIAEVLSEWPGREPEATQAYLDALELAREQQSPVEIRIVAEAVEAYGRRLLDEDLQRRALRFLVEVDPDDHQAWDRLALLGIGSEDEGEGVYLELLQKMPGSVPAHLGYSSHLVRIDRAGDAETHLRRVIENGLDDPRLWERLVRMTLSQGELAEARVLRAELAERHPGSLSERIAGARLSLAEDRAAEAAKQIEAMFAEEDSVELRLLMALAELRLGRLQAARESIERAKALAQPPSDSVIQLQGHVDYATRRWTGAVEAYRTLQRRGRPLGDAERVRLAVSLYHTGRTEEGLRLLDEILSGAAPPGAAALALADLLGDVEPERTLVALEAAHQREPSNHDVIDALTRLDLRAGREEAAMTRLNRVIGAGMARPETLLLRAQLLVRTGTYGQAESDALRAFEADPTLPGAIDLLVTVYDAQGRLDEARRALEREYEAGALHSGARLLLARLYLRDGDLERAQAMLEQVVERHPELWSAKNALAFLLADRGVDMERALRLAEEADAASGETPATADTLGFVHLEAGRPDAALRQFETAIRLVEERSQAVPPSFHFHRGIALRELGRDAEARTAFEAALARGDFPEAEAARRQLEAARPLESEPPNAS